MPETGRKQKPNSINEDSFEPLRGVGFGISSQKKNKQKKETKKWQQTYKNGISKLEPNKLGTA